LEEKCLNGNNAAKVAASEISSARIRTAVSEAGSRDRTKSDRSRE
jgi:hypothetical protein